MIRVPSLALAWTLLTLLHASAAPTISEFMASNEATLADADGDFPDWIEVHNAGTAPVDLLGHHLTDDPSRPVRWTFPSRILAPGERIVVFASGKDRTDPAAELHTDFKLSADGGYLALFAPDGTTALSNFAPSYPQQNDDQSYGIGYFGAVSPATLFSDTAPARYLIPTDRSLGDSWVSAPDSFDDSAWASGAMGLGWESESPNDPLLPLIATNLHAAMYGENASGYFRIHFTFGSTTRALQTLELRTRIDDGYIAYLNGVEIARENAPENASYNSESIGGGRTDTNIVAAPLIHDLSKFSYLVRDGDNVLAIHALNSAASGSDFLLRAELACDVEDTSGGLSAGYLDTPTPRAPNTAGMIAGPLFGDVTEKVERPTPGTDFEVRAKAFANNAPIASMDLHYRVMFEPEVVLPMSDPDGDGTYTATIPGSAFAPGEMIRWRFVSTDSQGTASTEPRFAHPTDSHQYWGTAAINPAVESKLSVAELFIDDLTAAESKAGHSGAIFYLGELYDKVYFNRHGQSTGSFRKKSFNIDFNKTQRFLWHPDEERVKDIDLMTNWADKSKVRHVLAYEVMREAGVHTHFAFTVRVQHNGSFFSTADFIEDADDVYLERTGLNPDGVLYKIYDNRLEAGQTGNTGVEKKTRRDEGNQDLTDFISGLHAGTAEDQWAFIYDNVNLPMMVNLLASYCVTRNTDVHRKNWYIYRDTGKTDEWAILPWDLDLSHGRKWNSSDKYFDNALHTFGFVQVGQSVQLIGKMWNRPDVKAMVLRRIRTLSDRFLQHPDTPLAERYYERRLDELSALIDPPDITPSDARQDFEKWGSWLHSSGTPVAYTNADPSVEDMAEAIDRWRTEYLPGRRNEIYNIQTSSSSSTQIPPAQASPTIDFGRIEFKPDSGNQDEEFIELLNNNTVAVDISDWQVTGGVEFDIPPGTVVPAGGTIFLSPDVAAFRARTASPTGGEQNFVIGGYRGHLSNRGETLGLLDETGAVNNTATFAGDPSDAQRYLVVSELMYHPYSPGAAEYIELLNISDDVTLDLNGVRFTAGIAFDFSSGSIHSLAPGGRALVVRDISAFEATFGTGHPVAGIFADGKALSNGGEKIKIEDADNSTIREFTYDDVAPWPTLPDGDGPALVLIDPASDPDHGLAASWTAGISSPGADYPARFSGDPEYDADGDGLSAFVEFGLGTDDRSPTSGRGALVVGHDGTSPTFSYRSNIAATDITISIETSTDLADWVDATSVGLVQIDRDNHGDGSETITLGFAPPSAEYSARQFRLKMTR